MESLINSVLVRILKGEMMELCILIRRRVLERWAVSWGYTEGKIDAMIRDGMLPCVRPGGHRSRRLYKRDECAEVLGIEPIIKEP